MQVQGHQIVQGQHEQELVQERGLPVEEEQGQVRRAESVVDGILRGADCDKQSACKWNTKKEKCKNSKKT